VVGFPFIPREQKFFDLFEQSARNAVKAARALKELFDRWEDIKCRVDGIAEMEHEGDTITHEIIAQLNRTFVTPLDREDIALLAHSLDDIMDCIDAAANDVAMYKVDHSPPRAKELTGLLVQAATEVEKAIPKLRHRGGLKEILTPCVEINRLENAADDVFRLTMAELFDDPKDIAGLIKWREIYEHIEDAADRCEDVSNVLEGVALKYA